ncbi:MAG: hypothetical protein M1832_005151 [Thelocarpon impressellum]|nr:MAG: hypothetical protein M1832_005151 [Thelocarpon impressellum]
MAASSRRGSIPGTPRVISPSPTPSEGPGGSGSDASGYFGPVTRSATKHRGKPAAIDEEEAVADDASGSESSFEMKRARTRSRSPGAGKRLRRASARASLAELSATPTPATRKGAGAPAANGASSNGHLSPSSASPASYWRELSRSPSPLGLIPIHRHWRSLIHRHEIPRKLLHVSIGFITLTLYASGVQPSAITPKLLAALVPIATIDYLRHRYPDLNRVYVRVCGALMRESEVAGWNGVVWYLLGAYLALRVSPKDVGVAAVLLLSWCDTAASTVGRAWGRYTPRVRRGKSVAGSLAAFVVGVGTALAFWGWFAPRWGPFVGDSGANAFLFQGTLRLPLPVRNLVGWPEASVSGAPALAVVGLWTGLVGAASEAVDLWGLDDNLTIPVLSAVGLWAFLKVFT